MKIGDKIRIHRKALGLTQTELGEKLGVQKNAVSKWECGRVDDIPGSKIKMMAALFNVPTSYLIDEEANTAFPSPISAEASPIVPVYNALNDAGKKELVRYGRYLGEQPDYQALDPDAEIEYIRHYLVPAAAGYASPIEGEDYELIPKDSKTPYKADFCIDIDGDSMEPYIHDGQAVYVQRDASLTDFDVGVFFVDGNVFCKQYCIDCFGTLYLLSANPKREDANITIRPDSGQTVICFGKVILPKKLPQPIYR